MMQHLRPPRGHGMSVVVRGDGSLTSNPGEIHDMFRKTWMDIYTRLEQNPPSYDDFASKYGEFVECEPTGDLCPTPQQLHAKNQAAKNCSAPGLDGWKPSELKKLPLEAWKMRHRLLTLIKETGKWPHSYLRVSAPSLRKADRLDPDSLRSPPSAKEVRLLAIYTQLYRIEVGAWFTNHMPWLEKHIHRGCVGGRKGLEAMMASWDAQSDLASAASAKTPFTMAFLDYFKFFDSFEPRFFRDFLAQAGLHRQFVDLFVHLNTESVRYIKIGDTFGPAMKPFNALGQGDPWVLLAALLYVSTQFKMLERVTPQVKKAAVIDDRTLHGPPEQVERALREVFVFDELAGHITHPDKVTLTTCHAESKKVMSKLQFDGISPKIVETQRLVGDTVTTLKRGAKQLANSRLDFALRAAAQTKAAECSQAAKHRAMKTVVIPKMTPSTLWTKPLDAKLNKLRTSIIGTVMGKKRNIRCPEIVTSVCLNPIKCDPKSVLLYRTLLDASWLMLKSDMRRDTFIRHLREMHATGQRGDDFVLSPAKGILQTNYELFVKYPLQGNDMMLYPRYGPPCSLFETCDRVFKNFPRAGNKASDMGQAGGPDEAPKAQAQRHGGYASAD